MIKREKRRYLALKAVTEKPVNEQTLLDAVHASVLRLFGEYGASKANIKLIKYTFDNSQMVIRCSHTMLDKVRAAIASTIMVDGKPAAIHVMGVSGTLKALSKKT